MAVTLSANYRAELKKMENAPDIILEIALDSGTLKIGQHSAFVDVAAGLGDVDSFQNKISPKSGFTSLGNITAKIVGRDVFKDLIKDEYLKNRRVKKLEGFIADGFQYSDYAETFNGVISEWSRNGDTLTLTIHDDFQPITKEVPRESTTGTHSTKFIDYSDQNPVDTMLDLIKVEASIAASLVETSKFESERDTWLSGWKFQRVLTNPEKIVDYLNELQKETNSFIVSDGELITFKVFAPSPPGTTTLTYTDDYHITKGSVRQKSGYSDFYNRIIFYYDYNEADDDVAKNFDSVHIVIDSASQGSGQWDETKTKIIKSKWIKSHTFTQPSNITGCTIYGLSKSNGISSGKSGHELSYNSTNKTLAWTAPDGTTGTAVNVESDGKYTIYDQDETKYVRVLITALDLPELNKDDEITITSLLGASHVASISSKLLNRYRDPVSTIEFSLDMNLIANTDNKPIKPTDVFYLTTDEATVKGKSSLDAEHMMILSMKPQKTKLMISCIQTKISERAAFIAPAGYPDYPSATSQQREYAFIGRASDNKVNGGTEEGYLII